MRALHRVLLDQPLRTRMKERGYQQAAKFSWETSVRRILDTYSQIAQKDRKPSRARARRRLKICVSCERLTLSAAAPET